MNKHYLVVSEDGLDVEHDKSCPIIEYGTGANKYYGYTCGVPGDNELENYFDIEELAPGKYPIEAWSQKTWTDYGWEWDGGLRFADEEKEKK